jgi:hypothetical protein
MTMLGSIGVTVNVQDAQAGDLDAAALSILKTFAWSITNGTGSNQADKLWSDTRTLAASANEDLDLSGSLSSLFGAFAPAKVKAVVIFARAANTNSVVISRPAANGLVIFAAASDALAGLQPGGVFVYTAPTAGIAVTAGTGDLLNIANSAGGTSVTYDIIVVGTSA